jgi:hypothetical protein
MNTRLVFKFDEDSYAVHYKNGIVTLSENDTVILKTHNQNEEKGRLTLPAPRARVLIYY